MKEEFLKNETGLFLVNKIGKPGIGTIELSLSLNDNLKNSLFYSLSPVDGSDSSLIPSFKKDIITKDPEVLDSNRLRFVDSSLSGSKIITGIGTTVFKYTVPVVPELLELTKNNSTAEYTTSSKTSGGVSKLNLKSRGSSLTSLPSFLSVDSEQGSDAILRTKTHTIGKINKTRKSDIGFNYYADKTLAPEGAIPTNLEIERFSILDRIGISLLD